MTTVSGTQSASAASSTSNAVSSALSSQTSGANAALGQDAFMKLLVAQIQNQDPLNPQSDTEFVSQLAQFSTLEQQTSTNQLLQLVSTQQTGLANTDDVQLIGKTVTVAGNTLTSGGQGFAVPGSYTLASAAASVSITVSDASGNVVRTIPGGAHAAGSAQFTWDGKNDTGTVQPAGSYTVSVTAKDAKGNPVTVNQSTTGVVQSLSFDSNGPLITLADGTQARTSALSQVSAAPAATK